MQFEQTQRYKVNRRRGAVRRPKPAEDDAIDRVAVRKWWLHCMNTGVLFQVLGDDARSPRDYTGSLPWPTKARGEALLREFTLVTGRAIDKMRFYYMFRSAAGIGRGDNTKMRMEHHNNKLMYMCSRVMYPVEDIRNAYIASNRV